MAESARCASAQAVSDNQRKLKQQYDNLKPSPAPGVGSLFSVYDSDEDTASTNLKEIRRKQEMAQDELAAKKAELQGLLRDKGRHDGMLKSELKVAPDPFVFYDLRPWPTTVMHCFDIDACVVI